MIEVRIPKMGMSTVEVDLIAVLVEPGQRIGIGDPLVEVESEKASLVIESEHAGVVTDIVVREGETYEVGDVICVVEPDG